MSNIMRWIDARSNDSGHAVGSMCASHHTVELLVRVVVERMALAESEQNSADFPAMAVVPSAPYGEH